MALQTTLINRLPKTVSLFFCASRKKKDIGDNGDSGDNGDNGDNGDT